MLPPKLGLLAYVADAYLAGRSDDILLQPVSISFDQLHETAEYAAYARGGEKTPEGVSWLYNFIKAQGERNYGKIYVRFPEAVSMREYLGEPHGEMTTDEAAKRLAMQKMAFEVAWRILRVTPVNATGLVSALLLTTSGVALTLGQLHHTLQDSLDYLERTKTPMTNSALRLRTTDGVRAAVDALSGGHPVTRVDGGREPVWRIAPEDEHEAAFYRNTLIHAFLETSIVELALAYAARAEGDRLEAFWAQAMRLRDLLKFEFYFADSAAFREHIAEEMSWHEDWERHVAAGGDEVDAMLRAKRPLIAGAMLRPFIEAYEIVADVLRDAAARHRREGSDQARAGRRRAVHRAGPGAQQRVGVGAAVRHRAAGGGRPESARARPPTSPNGARRSWPSCAASSATWTRSRRSPASSSSCANSSSAPRAADGALSYAPYAVGMTTLAARVPNTRTATVWPVLVGVGLLAGVTAAGIAALSLADALTATGLPDPGPVTTYGLPFFRAAGEIAAVVAVGSFLLAAFLVPPQAQRRPRRVGLPRAADWAPSPRASGRCARRCWCR